MPTETLRRDPSHYFNRQLSWLSFNDRVLSQAIDARQPVLERLKFLGIWSSNLDEFFQVRVAGLKEQVATGRFVPTPDGRTPSAALHAIRDEVDRQASVVARTYAEVLEELAVNGIVVLAWGDLDRRDRKHLTAEFENRIFPVLTPLAVDPGHPFPYISNLSLSLGAVSYTHLRAHET